MTERMEVRPIQLREVVRRKAEQVPGGWRMEDGGWRMEDEGWRMEDGGWRMEDGIKD